MIVEVCGVDGIMREQVSYHCLSIWLLSVGFLFHHYEAQSCDIEQDNLIIDWSDVYSSSGDSSDTLFYDITITQLNPSSSGSNVNTNEEIVNVIIMADYKVAATYSSISQNTQFGVTYVIDTKPFVDGSLLQDCGACENRHNSSYFNQSFIDDFWTYTLHPVSDIGNDTSGLEYPNPNIWSVSMNDSINDPCGVVKWEKNFTFDELYHDCGFTLEQTNDSLILDGSFYLTLLSPMSMFMEQCDNGHNDCGQYYSSLLLHPRLEIILQRRATVISDPIDVNVYTTMLGISTVQDDDINIRRRGLTAVEDSDSDSDGDYSVISLEIELLMSVDKDSIIDGNTMWISYTPIPNSDSVAIGTQYKIDWEISDACLVIDNDACYQRLSILLSLYVAENCTKDVSPSFNITGMLSIDANVMMIKQGNMSTSAATVAEARIDPVEISYVGFIEECCSNSSVDAVVDPNLVVDLDSIGPYVYVYTGFHYHSYQEYAALRIASFSRKSILLGIFVSINLTKMSDFTNSVLLYDITGQDGTKAAYQEMSHHTVSFLLPLVNPDNETIAILMEHLELEGIINDDDDISTSNVSNTSSILVYGIIYATTETVYIQNCDYDYNYDTDIDINSNETRSVLRTEYDQLVSINDYAHHDDKNYSFYADYGIIVWELDLTYSGNDTTGSHKKHSHSVWPIKKIWNLILVPIIIVLFVVGLVGLVCFCAKQSNINITGEDRYGIANGKRGQIQLQKSRSKRKNKNKNKNKNTRKNNLRTHIARVASPKSKSKRKGARSYDDERTIDLTQTNEQKIMLAKSLDDTSDDDEECVHDLE